MRTLLIVVLLTCIAITPGCLMERIAESVDVFTTRTPVSGAGRLIDNVVRNSYKKSGWMLTGYVHRQGNWFVKFGEVGTEMKYTAWEMDPEYTYRRFNPVLNDDNQYMVGV